MDAPLTTGSVHRGELRRWAEKRDWNLAVKCDLVERGQSHGVLVDSGEEPIGWCQFGPAAELPVFRVGRTPEVARTDDGPRRWRITCFCTDKRWREKGFERAGFDAKAVVPARGKLGTSRIVMELII